MKEIFICIILIAYVSFSGYYSIKLYKTNLLSNSKKFFNVLLVWLLPFIWTVLIKEIIFNRTNGSHEVGVKNDVSSNHFHESKKGFYG